MKTIKLSLVFILGMFILSLTSCEKEDKDPQGPPSTDHQFEVGAAKTVSVFGNVIDENGNPVSGAAVSLGGSSTVTDVNGVFFIQNASAYENHAYVKVEKAGFFLGSRSFVPGDDVDNVRIMLLAKQNIGSFDASAGGSVSGNGITIEFQDGVVDANGASYTGTVQVAAKYIDPESDDFFDYMPGNLIGADENGGNYLESKGMVAVELSDGAGNELQPASGSDATVSFPLSAGLLAGAPATIDLWHFDEDAGYWVLEGEASLQGNAYVATVSHFSFWNCDIPTDYVILDGQLLEGGLGVPNIIVRIVSTGFGTGAALTDASGGFSGIVPANDNLTLEVWFDCGGSEVFLHSQSLGSLSSNTTLTPISITGGGTTVAVSGTVVDCAYAPVANGYLQHSGGHITYLSSGVFNIFTCSGSSLDMQGFDIDNMTESGVSTYTLGAPATFNVGQIVACNALTEYIHWNVNGVDYVSTTNFNFYEQGSYAGMSGNIPNYFSANFNSFSGIGAYVFDAVGANYIYGAGIWSITSGSINIDVTQFGSNPGDLIEANISGSFMAVDSLGGGGPAVSQTISGNIHFFRN